MATVGYFPYADTACSVEAGWLAEHLSVEVRTAHGAPSLNDGPPQPRPTPERLSDTVGEFLALPAVVAEGPGGFLWAALLRAHGFAGTVTVLPYLNLRRWYDVAAAALYRRFAAPRDRVFLGSWPSAAVYRALGIQALVGEPYGIDDRLFGFLSEAARARDELSIPPGRLLLFAGRAQPDKDLYRLLRVGLKARLLFPDLQVVIASHVIDRAYMMAAHQQLGKGAGVHFVVDPTSEQLVGLYNAADVFVTASTSHFETFGRAPAEALACGCPAVAPRYDGFVEVLAQPGGSLVDVEVDPRTGTPRVHEELLLRAVYDVLSSPRPPPRREVAAIARRRFGRSATIGLLGFLVDGAPRQPMAALPPARIELPGEWRQPLAEIAARDAMDALSWFWDGCDHDRFAAHDPEFAADVRRSLCVPMPRAAGGPSECP
jgi:glycosyltransferase involved in cell wall biosynthesis